MMKRPPKMASGKKATKNTTRQARAAASARRLYNQVDLNDVHIKDEVWPGSYWYTFPGLSAPFRPAWAAFSARNKRISRPEGMLACLKGLGNELC